MNRWPSVAHMVSYQHNLEEIKQLHKQYLEYYGATLEDCELIDLKKPPIWDNATATYSLMIKSYKGWKVYQLHCGCLATIPELEGQ